MQDSAQILDFAVLFDEETIGQASKDSINTAAFFIHLPDSDSNEEALSYLARDVEGEEGVCVFDAQYHDQVLTWQGINGKKVGLSLKNTALACMPLTHFMPAFFIAQNVRTGEVLSQGAIQLTQQA